MRGFHCIGLRQRGRKILGISPPYPPLETCYRVGESSVRFPLAGGFVTSCPALRYRLSVVRWFMIELFAVEGFRRSGAARRPEGLSEILSVRHCA